MGFGLYSVKDPSQYATSALSGAAATASRMDKATQIDRPGPSVGGAIATGLAGAITGAAMGKDIGLKKGLPAKQPTPPGKGTIGGHMLETAETAGAALAAQTPKKITTQKTYEKYGAGVGAISGILMHLLS